MELGECQHSWQSSLENEQVKTLSPDHPRHNTTKYPHTDPASQQSTEHQHPQYNQIATHRLAISSKSMSRVAATSSDFLPITCKIFILKISSFYIKIAHHGHHQGGMLQIWPILSCFSCPSASVGRLCTFSIKYKTVSKKLHSRFIVTRFKYSHSTETRHNMPHTICKQQLFLHLQPISRPAYWHTVLLPKHHVGSRNVGISPTIVTSICLHSHVQGEAVAALNAPVAFTRHLSKAQVGMVWYVASGQSQDIAPDRLWGCHLVPRLDY